MKIWERKPPGTIWATLGLLWDSFTFSYAFECKEVRMAYCSLSAMLTALKHQESSYSAQPTENSVANHLIYFPIQHGVQTQTAVDILTALQAWDSAIYVRRWRYS
jgi:hypothetical protein